MASLLSWLGVTDTPNAEDGHAAKQKEADEAWGATAIHSHAGGLGPSGCSLAFEPTQRLLAVGDSSGQGRVKVHGAEGAALLAAPCTTGSTVSLAFKPSHACLLRLAEVRPSLTLAPPRVPAPVRALAGDLCVTPTYRGRVCVRPRHV
jgi:hypothetical protein